MSLIENFDFYVDVSPLYKPSNIQTEHKDFFKEVIGNLTKWHSFLREDGSRVLNARRMEIPDAEGAFKELQYAYVCSEKDCIKIARVLTPVERGDVDEILANKERTNRLKELFKKILEKDPNHTGLAIPFAFKLDVLKNRIEFNEFSDLYQGSLDRFIPEMSKQEKDEATSDIIAGLKTLHELGIAHQDFKAQNILFRRKNGRAEAAICDLDMYVEGAPNQWFWGTLDWFSPERLAAAVHGVIQTQEILLASDVYALGRVLYHFYMDDRMGQENLESYWPTETLSINDRTGILPWDLGSVEGIAARQGEYPFEEPSEPLEHLIWEMLGPQVYRPSIQEVADRWNREYYLKSKDRI